MPDLANSSSKARKRTTMAVVAQPERKIAGVPDPGEPALGP